MLPPHAATSCLWFSDDSCRIGKREIVKMAGTDVWHLLSNNYQIYVVFHKFIMKCAGSGIRIQKSCNKSTTTTTESLSVSLVPGYTPIPNRLLQSGPSPCVWSSTDRRQRRQGCQRPWRWCLHSSAANRTSGCALAVASIPSSSGPWGPWTWAADTQTPCSKRTGMNDDKSPKSFSSPENIVASIFTSGYVVSLTGSWKIKDLFQMFNDLTHA